MNQASPQLQDGFIQIANELFSALCCADFSKGATVVLREALGQLFHRDGPKVAEISPSVIAAKTGIKRQYVSRGVAELVESGALIRVDKSHYRFVKDYTKWTRNGEPRLTKEERSYAVSVRRKAANPDTKLVAPDTKSVSGAYQISCGDDPNQFQVHTKLVAPKAVPPGPPIEERTRNEELIQEIRQDKTRQSDEPAYPDPETSFLTIRPGGANTTEAEARSIWSSLWAQWHKASLCQEFYQHQRWYTAAVWRAAIRKAVIQGKAIHRISYVETIAEEYATKGIPSEVAPKHGESGYVPPSQTVQVKYYQDPWLPAEVA